MLLAANLCLLFPGTLFVLVSERTELFVLRSRLHDYCVGSDGGGGEVVFRREDLLKVMSCTRRVCVAGV